MNPPEPRHDESSEEEQGITDDMTAPRRSPTSQQSGIATESRQAELSSERSSTFGSARRHRPNAMGTPKGIHCRRNGSLERSAPKSSVLSSSPSTSTKTPPPESTSARKCWHSSIGSRRRDIDYVIVHQLSRFARNRLDDAVITQRLEAAGAILVSCLEGIDQTPSGRMLQGVLASLNEYQSTNQSEDIKRKTLQKVKDGGTPSLAPIGYRNVQGAEADKNSRWVEIDPERADHIKWAFSSYASGNYSLRQLADALEERGLTQRPTKNQPSRPLPANKLQTVLRNRYYLGIVTYKGIEYEGKHPKLIDQTTFDRVQHSLEAHRQSGERAHRHTHYLKGSLRCHRCKSRLAYCVSRGNGGSYAYFFCLGRHHGRTDCDLPRPEPR